MRVSVTAGQPHQVVANLRTAQAQRANSTIHAARRSHPEPPPSGDRLPEPAAVPGAIAAGRGLRWREATLGRNRLLLLAREPLRDLKVGEHDQPLRVGPGGDVEGAGAGDQVEAAA